MSQVRFQLQFDSRGHTAVTDDAGHIHDLVEQVLFTSPGERVNRPTFGSGLQQMVFEPTSDAIAGTLQYVVQGALQQWLGDLIDVQSLEVTSEESKLTVRLVYVMRRTQQRVTDVFVRQGAAQ
jgi:phage baseplate assembly protein W